MTESFINKPDYSNFINQIKQTIQQARTTVIRTVQTEVIVMYYNIGKQIGEMT